MTRHLLPLFAALALLSQATQAHVTLEYPVATAGQGYKATFKIAHGCGSSPTRVVEVDIPAGGRGAKPPPQPGWPPGVPRRPLGQPYPSHRRTITEDTTRIRWSAKTEADQLSSQHYDEFVLVATLTAQAGRLYWPVRQVCPQGRLDWTERPGPGQTWHDLASPAAELELMPAASGAHKHH